MFIRKISLPVLFVCLGWAQTAIAVSLSKESTWNELLATMPDGPAKVLKDKKYVWAEYCPDNTCDVIRMKSNFPAKGFGYLAAAYYYHYSKYAYLETWRNDLAVGKLIDENLIALDRSTCQSVVGKELARCRFEILNRRSGLEFFFIRFDEGRRSRVAIPAKEVLQ